MDFPHGFWESELWKEAARAGLRQISKMVSGGNIAGASRMATTPGVLKPSAAGSQIKHLGRGSEGLATLVAHPEHGVSVRKLYDPQGISTPAMIARKEEAGRALGNNPNFSRFNGSAPTPHGGGTMHFSEYVPQSGAQPTDHTVQQTGDRARQALQNVGYEGHDIRRGNMAVDATTGQAKVIDYIPGKPGEITSRPTSVSDAQATAVVKKPRSAIPGNSITPAAPKQIPDQNPLRVSPEGSHLFRSNTNQTPTKDMLGGMLGGKAITGIPRAPTAVGTPRPETPKPPTLGDSIQKRPKPVAAIKPI